MALHNKKLEKSTIVRLVIISLTIVADLIILPWLLKLPFFLVKDLINAPTEWFKFGIINSWKEILYVSNFRNLYLFMQLPVIGIMIAVGWNTEKFKKKNRITDGVGGPEPAGNGQHGTSRWQNKNEMDKTADVWCNTDNINVSGIVLGMEKSSNGKEKIWTKNDDVHTLIIGSTRSGKGRKIILPSIWGLAKAGENIIAGDPKGELYITCKPYLLKQGYNVIALNLRDPLKGNQWNILSSVNKAVDDGDIAKATELAWDIANTITKQKPRSSDQPIWENGEESTIAALILLTCLESQFKFQRHMTTVYYLLAEYGRPIDGDVVPLDMYINNLDTMHPAKSAYATASLAPRKMKASFFTQALSDLRLFSDINVSDMTSVQDHIIENIGIEKTAVFLIIPDEKSTRNVLATLYIDQVYQTLVGLANKLGGRIPKRVNFILDEFGNLPPIPEFSKKVTVAGSRGMRFTIAVQDINQINELYKNSAQTITGNCHTWIYLKTANNDTAKLLSEKTGKYTVETENSSSSMQSKGHSISHGQGLTGRNLLMADEILRWNGKESLILSLGNFPARYPIPDLALWQANTDYELTAPTGNNEKDQVDNNNIFKNRWNLHTLRKLKTPNIWQLNFNEPAENENKNVENVEKAIEKSNDEHSIEVEEEDFL